MLSELRTLSHKGHKSTYVTIHGEGNAKMTKAIRKVANQLGVRISPQRWWFVGDNWNAFVGIAQTHGVEIPAVMEEKSF